MEIEELYEKHLNENLNRIEELLLSDNFDSIEIEDVLNKF